MGKRKRTRFDEETDDNPFTREKSHERAPKGVHWNVLREIIEKNDRVTAYTGCVQD